MSAAVDATKPTTFSAIFKHVSPPTTVDNCLYCNLMHPKLKNLVITRSGFIEIYNIKSSVSGETRFNWVYGTSVYDNIADIVSVRFAGDLLDSLLLSFSEAKVAVMNFNPITFELRTLSLHNYEFENLKSGRMNFTKLPILRLDPYQRCAVMLVYDRHLAVLPFRRTEVLVSAETDPKHIGVRNFLLWQQRATAPLLATFTTCLSTSTGEKINNVLDMQFLHGFYEPTLLVLYEPIGTWAGRVSARRDTCCIVALSFNLQKRTNPVIWFQESLPFDCRSVIPVPQPIGGVVIMAANSILYLKQTLPSCSLPLNCYAQISTNFPMRQDVPSCGPLSIDGCRVVTLNETQFLIGTRSGNLYLLSLWLEQATQTVTSLLFHQVGHAVPPHCMVLLESKYLFIGSRFCDSVLMKINHSLLCVDASGKEVDYQLLNQPSGINKNSYPTENKSSVEEERDEIPNKFPRIEDEKENDNAITTPKSLLQNSDKNALDEIDTMISTHYKFDKVDVELYGESILNPPSNYREIVNYSFQVVDRLINLGPMGQLTSGEVPCLAPGNTDPTDEALTCAQTEMHHVELLACIPRLFNVPTEKNPVSGGGIALLHTSIRPRGLTAFELPEYMSLWSLYGPPIMTAVQSIPSSPAYKLSETANSLSVTPNKILGTPCFSAEEKNDEIIVEKPSEFPEDIAKTTGISESIADDKTQEESSKELESVVNTSNANENEFVNKANFDTESESPSGLTHSYLLLTREDSTMILEVSHEIVELEVSGFNTTEMTVGAFNLGFEYIQQAKRTASKSDNNDIDNTLSTVSSDQSATSIATSKLTRSSEMKSPKEYVVGIDYPYILQVSPTSLRLLDGPRLLEYVQVTLEWRIHLASCADPYVLLCTEDDELFLVQLKNRSDINKCSPIKKSSSKIITSTLVDENGDQPPKSISTVHLEVIRPKVRQVSAPLCFSLYHDHAGRLARWLWACKNLPADSSFFNLHITDSQDHLFTCPGVTSWPEPESTTTPDNTVPFSSPTEKSTHLISTSEEESILLYGEPVEICKRESSVTPGNNTTPRPPRILRSTSSHSSLNNNFMETSDIIDNSEEEEKLSRYFAFIVFTNGVLEIYSLPDFTLLYEVHHFTDLPQMLIDHRGVGNEQLHRRYTNPVNVPYTEDDSIPPPILEILVYPIGIDKDRPVLVVRTSQEIAFFEALCPSPGEAYPLVSGSFYEGRLRWRRLPLPCPLVAPRRVRTDPKIMDVQSTLQTRTHMLRCFENIGDHRGVFVCGGNPMWLFATESGQLRVFPHSIDGIMGSFAPLNATICHSGFVYFTFSNEMRLANLPPGYSFNEHIGIKWITLDPVPYYVQYHVESKTYAVVGFHSEPCKSVFRLNAEGNKEEDILTRPRTCVLPTLDYYSLQMYAPNLNANHCNKQSPWLSIPNTHIDFEPWEVVTCLITAQLSSEETFHGKKDYLALGANLSYGEEIPVRGRILILDVIDVVPEPDQPLTRHKLKIIHDGEQKGPVTALTSCQGHLISAIGQKIYIWTLKNTDLVGVAFVDSELYIHNLLCVKNLVLAADVLKSIQLLRFQSDLRVLSVVSRDNIPREVFTSNFFVDGRRLGFLVSDELGNITIYSYDPLDPSSRSGRRLVRCADMRLPSCATCSLRVANRLRHALLSVKPSASSTATATLTTGTSTTNQNTTNTNLDNLNRIDSANQINSFKQSQQLNPQQGGISSNVNSGIDPEKFRQSIYFGSQDGSIYRIGPIRDKMYSRLRITEKNLIHHLGPVCGMPPKSCWSYSRPQPELANPCGKVADGDLIWRYLTLPHCQRLEIAKKSGQSLESIMDDIAELIATTLHF
ncbi:Cleavage and polyadenylation specificity factor subunit 1 [Schistosoma japonicum]|nr:Cleavage and polyadenylation specificity factor subunit 1 [Schistosoma japonicum]